MSTKDPNAIHTDLAQRAAGRSTGTDLVFDPGTGELVVQRQGSAPPNPDATVIDQIAEDGFYAAARP